MQQFNLLREHNISPDLYRKMIGSDKKREGSDVSFVLLEGEGKAVIKKMAVSKLIACLEKIRKSS